MGLSVALLVGAAVLAISGGPHFTRMRDGATLSEGWRADVSRSEAGWNYVLVDAGGHRHRLDTLRFDDLEWALLKRAKVQFLITRYFGEGTSGATYYTVYRLNSEGPVPLRNAITRDWTGNQLDSCLSEPRIEEPPNEPTTLFAACPEPSWDEDVLVFLMPGYHCSQFEYGGCLREDVVRLR